MIRVLIADDHPIVRKGLQELVAGESDMKVTAESGNGLEVLRLIETERFDIVLLDISMPGMSGLEILQKIRPEHPNLPIRPERLSRNRTGHANAQSRGVRLP